MNEDMKNLGINRNKLEVHISELEEKKEILRLRIENLSKIHDELAVTIKLLDEVYIAIDKVYYSEWEKDDNAENNN